MKNIQQLLDDWRASKKALEKLVRDMPRIMGNEAVKVVKDNFRLQGYDTGHGVIPWAPRSPATNSLYDKRVWVKGSVYNSGNPILMQTWNLYNAIKYEISNNKVTIGVNLFIIPYAKWMNEGTSGSIPVWGKGGERIRKPTRTPARQYMPSPDERPNDKILRAIEKKVEYEKDKALSLFKK